VVRGERGQDQACFGDGITQAGRKQDAAMRMQVAMDQDTDIVILRQEDAPPRGGFGQQRLIARVRRPLGGTNDIVAGISHGAHGLRDKCSSRLGDARYSAAIVRPSAATT
jgi:hypothetical protein